MGYRLVWDVAFRMPDAAPTWTARVDALSGEVLEFFDANQYAGQVVGGIFPRTVSDQEVLRPFPFTTWTGSGVTGTTDVNGKFTVPPGSVSASVMDGKYFDTSCQGCSNPAQPFASRTAGLGLVSFGTGGTDQNGNGLSSRADRNAFYHLNIVRLVTKKWLVNSWLDTASFRANVNINSSCNAYYDGVSVNFYRSSSSCSNTGEISDVMQHEWGHGLDGHTAGGDGATGEATADTVAVHVTHSSIVGPWFRVGGGSVRDLDYHTTSKGYLSTTNIGGKCSTGSGPLGYEVHCEGEIYGQATWDLANALIAKYGANTGWRESERLFFTSMPQTITYLPNQGGSVYDAYLAVDDDDGNLANGTPNAGEIFAALNPHGMGGTARASSPHCARPDQPVLTATAGCDKVTLNWSAVTGATQYRIGRTWLSGSAPFLDVATVPSGTLTYTDNDVTPGILYRYVVQAVNASGCESSINAEAFTMPVSRPRLDVTAVTVDDTPVGNRSGAIDPGESVDLRLTLSNAGDAAASGIGATLTSSTPGVTVTTSSASWPTIEAGAAAAGLSAFRIAVSPSVTCGAPIDLVLTTTAAGVSCPLETNTIRLEVGVRSPVRIDHNFETTNSWAADATNTTATSGGWVRGIPIQTNYQPGADVTLNGTTCWHTGTQSRGQRRHQRRGRRRRDAPVARHGPHGSVHGAPHLLALVRAAGSRRRSDGRLLRVRGVQQRRIELDGPRDPRRQRQRRGVDPEGVRSRELPCRCRATCASGYACRTRPRRETRATSSRGRWTISGSPTASAI